MIILFTGKKLSKKFGRWNFYSMNTVGTRLKMLRNKQSGEQFSSLLGIHLQSLYRYERGERHPDAELLQTVSKKTGVSLEWLICGNGPMHAGGPAPETQNSPECPAIPTKTDGQCPRCERLEAKLEKVELQRDELAQENRQLWKENGELRERCATLEERQKQCCPDQYHPKKANTPSSDPLHI